MVGSTTGTASNAANIKGPYNTADTCVVKSTPGVVYKLIVSGCVSNVLAGAVSLKDSVTTLITLNAGHAGGCIPIEGTCNTNITITMGAAGDSVTVIYI